MPELFPSDKRIHFSEIDSTNTEARRMLNDRPVAELAGTVLIADHQTAGRGRQGRQFYSPADTGLYMTVILRPDDSLIQTDLVTPAAGVAVCRALEKLAPGCNPQIKWVNDVYIDERKVCGILTEGSISDTGVIQGIILGIGINIREAEAGFPEDIKDIAGTVCKAGQKLSRDSLADELLFQLTEALKSERSEVTVEEYRKRSLVVGKTVTVLTGHSDYLAVVVDVTQKCHLLVRVVEGNGEVSPGEMKELLSGEVSLKIR